MIILCYPIALTLLILPIITYFVLPSFKGLHGDAISVPDEFLQAIEKISSKSEGGITSKVSAKFSNINKFIFLYLIWTLLVISVCRPQIVGDTIPTKREGREIMLVLDISNSMQQLDLGTRNNPIDRLSAVKYAAKEFISNRTNDKIGLILFATNAYLQVPLTYDKSSLITTIDNMTTGLAGNSTAIGDALGLALKTMRKTDTSEKAIILLTDGENNDGSISIAEAIDMAEKEKIKIYTIGVGKDDALITSMLGFNFNLGNSGIDEKSLKEIAQKSQGQYFRARNAEDLINIYKSIDKLEPTINDDLIIKEVKDIYYIPLLIAFILSVTMLVWVKRVKK